MYGVLCGIYARMTEKYDKNKSLIYTLAFTILLLAGTIFYEVFSSIEEGKIVFPSEELKWIIFYQVALIPSNIYFIIRAYKILEKYNGIICYSLLFIYNLIDIQRVKNELQNEVYYRHVDLSFSASVVL